MIELAQVRHPAAPRPNPRRLRTGALGWYRELRDEFPEYHPLPIWPEPGGFLPFASSIDGDSIGWLTDGEPDRWPLIVEPRHHEQGRPAIPCSTRSSDSVPTEIRMNRSHDSPYPIPGTTLIQLGVAPLQGRSNLCDHGECVALQ